VSASVLSHVPAARGGDLALPQSNMARACASRLQTLFLLQLLHAMLEHVTLLQRQDECMDQSYNAHEENESRGLCSPAVSTAAWTTRLRLSPIKALRGDEERDRARAREGGREREHFIQEGNRAPVLETTHSRNWATRGFAC
jgi:hypothetical protein